jgi:hypothetical protein
MTEAGGTKFCLGPGHLAADNRPDVGSLKARGRQHVPTWTRRS